jgi:hypothetical protein
MAAHTRLDVAEAKTPTWESHRFSISGRLLSLCTRAGTSVWQTFKISHNIINTSEMGRGGGRDRME